MRTSDATEALTANRTPEMFASRRRKRLELMSEERERTAKRGAGEGKVTVTNETKPYAGDGALRKLLARRKQETTEEEQPKLEPETRSVDLSVKSNRILPTSIVNDVPPPPPLPVPTGPDFFAPTTNSSLEGGSSLRVGRTISSRKHIHRPSPLQRPSTSKFSAVYEEEGDDVMGDTAKVDSVPQLFAEPVGFSFAKDVSLCVIIM
jgi:nucleoporin NUP1